MSSFAFTYEDPEYDYEARVRAYIEMGMSRSDAQGVVDAEMLTADDFNITTTVVKEQEVYSPFNP